MDRVRFGRALGYGARHAAKTLAQAVEAASSQPASGTRGPETQAPVDLRRGVAEAGRTALQAHQTVEGAKSRVRGAAAIAGKSALAPVKKFSSVLWLEVTGTFFALVAAAMADAVWKLRGALELPATSNERLRLYGCVALVTLFAYFAVSNFVRASRRQKQ